MRGYLNYTLGGVDSHGMGKPSDLVQGTLDLLILKTISLEPKHGWQLPSAFNKSRRKFFKFTRVALPRFAPTGTEGMD